VNITTNSTDGVTVVNIQGDIDGKSAPEAQQQIVPLISEHSKLLLDMSGVGYMSSAGLRVMLLLYRQAASQDGQIALVGLSEDIEDTMSATGFLDFFTTCQTVEEGVAALAKAE